MMNNELLVQDMIRTSRELLAACDALELAGRDKAMTEDRYRYAKSVAMVRLAGTLKNAAEREANVHLARVEDVDGEPVTVGDLRFRRDLAEASAGSAMERVRSLRGILSGFQTQANALREELRLANAGPHMEP